MKKLLLGISLLFMLSSCSDDLTDSYQLNSETRNISLDENITNQKAFSKILSKAVYNEEAIRSFIKEEALLQFDNDYDVFYPFIKNKKMPNGKTFRETLLDYCTEDELIEIEKKLPLLNILVPDLSLFCDFNPHSWDVTDEEIAIISRDDNDNILYVNGNDNTKLPLNEVPGFPCLVVKNNERLEVSTGFNLKSSSSLTYNFISDVFDGSKPLPRQTNHSYFEEDVEYDSATDPLVIPSSLHPSIIEAYNIYKDNVYGYDRDFVYYGIKNKTDIGEINRYTRESIYRFKLNPNTYKIIADQDGKDGKLQSTTEKKRYLTTEEIIKRVWTDGMFEFIFTCMVSDQNSTESMKQTLVMNLKPSNVFSVKKVSVEHVNNTAFRHSKNTYTVNPDNLGSKWIYPANLSFGNEVFLQPWDLYTKSLVIHMSVDEKDDGQTTERTETFQNEYAHKADFEGTGTFGKFGAKIGYGFSSKESKTTSTKVTTTSGSDHLGTLTFYFYDPIIVGERKVGSRTKYKLYTVNNGSIEVTLLPKFLR